MAQKESLFKEIIDKVFPKLTNIIETINGKKKQLTYLHKTMLRKEYSADQKWESASLNTHRVAADMVAMDSPVPLKSRDAISHSSGVLPKIGMKRALKESDLNAVNVMIAQNASSAQIMNKLINDSVACSIGVDERNEANFLIGLSEGLVAIEDTENTGTALRVDFGYLTENQFGVASTSEISHDDIKRVITKADEDGNTITTIALALSTYNKLRQTQWAKELVANYRGQVYTNPANLAVPTASVFDEAFADDNGGIKFLKIDRSIMIEKDGKRKSWKPWNANKLIFLTTEDVGALVWGTLAEQNHRVEGVTYTVIDDYKLVSKFSKTDPLQEWTAVQALVLPVIENVDQIYSLDSTQVQA